MKTPVRIAYLIDTISSDKAGTEKQLLNLIQRLDEPPIVICLHESNWLSCNRLPCETFTLGYKGFLYPSFPMVLLKYLRIIQERDIELVQTFFEDSMFVGYLGNVLCRSKHSLIISRRDLGLGSDEPSYHGVYRKVRPFVFRAADGIATNAQAIKSSVAENDMVPMNKIAVIGNGLDIPDHPHVLPRIFSEFHADVWVGIVANLKPIKRVDLLIDALAKLIDSGVSQIIRVLILGEGRLKSELMQLAVEQGVADRIHFIGAVDNVTDYLYGLDVGVLCSDKEGLSNAILEYMACGLPVVATDAGGNAELVDATNGVCIPIGDHIALAQALANLISNPTLRKQMGLRSLEKIKLNFTWDKIIPQWENYYESFCRRPISGISASEGTRVKT